MPRCAAVLASLVLFGLTPLSADAVPPSTINLTASATNTVSNFNKYLFTFPLSEPALLTGISGSVTISSRGENFAEGLFGVFWLPAGSPHPRDGEVYADYPSLTARYPALQTIVHFIVKQPSHSPTTSTIPVEINLPAGVAVRGRLVIVLDGSVLRTGGHFVMDSHLVMHFSPLTAQSRPASVIGLDDEYCFGQNWGGERATQETNPHAAMMDVVPVTQDGQLLALYGDLSDSAFGPDFSGPAGPGPWAISNDYYLYPHSALPPGQNGPGDYYASIPADATKLYGFEMQAVGQVVKQRAVDKPISGVMVHRGDCLVHLVRMTHASDQGGINAENQVFALVRPLEPAK